MNFGKQAANVSQSIPFSSTNDKKFQAQLNTRVIKLYDFYEIFSLEADRSVTNITSNLYIYKATGKIKEGYDKLKGQMEEFSGFLGIINVLGVNFLVLVKEVNVLFVLDGNDKIFEIASVEFKEVSENPDASKLTKEVQSFLDRIDKILSGGGYYFSYKYPVTLSQQKMFELQNNNSGQQQQKVGSNLSNQLNSKEQQPANIFHFVDYDFMWNYNLMKPLIQQKVSPDWIAQMIQGHVFNIVAHTKNLLYYTLISRRSMRRGGTRFSHRGINSDGFVANFVETEQILIIPSADCIVSHVQIRGSVPTFWKQKGLSAKIIVDSSKLLCNQACKLHLDYLNKNYNEISCANLMSASSTNEQKLTKEYIEQVRDGANQRSTVSYLEFDFHHEVKGEKFDSIDNFIKANLLKVIQKHQYFIRNVKGDILKKQVGIIRTNCVDCLDRTNFFQLRVAFNTLNHVIFPLLNLNFKSQSDGEKFQKDFQQCWGENGDNISMHYADTNATTSNVAKTGKQGVLGFLKGKLSSAKRFFKGNLTDAVKQQCYCIILGEHYETQENLGFQEDMQRELKQREEEFIKKSNIKIFACTWNLNAYLPEKTTHYLNNIFIHNQKYELVVMAFQELVELKPQNLMMSTHQKHNSQNYWQQIILHNLGKDYFLVNSANLVGIQTLIFARNELNGRISEIEIDTVKCGFAGQLGNKGGVAVRLNIDDTSIAFLNCHLPAGQSKVNDRLSALQQCMQLSYQQEGMAAYKKDPLNKSDKFVLLGDLNFRVDRKYADCLSAINKYKDLKKDFKLHEAQALLEEQILNFDQLTCIRKLQDRPRSSSNISAIDTQMNIIPKSMSNLSVPENSNAMEKSQIIKTLYEKRIHFLPTYKFDSGTDTYDTSKKQRVPSFCDRIMIWDIENDNAQIEDQILLYESCNLDNSDHKPVCAVIQFQVKFIDKDLREQVIEEIINVQTQQSKDLESLRSTNNPPNQSEINIDFIFAKNDNQNQNAQEMQNVQYIQKHQKNDLIQFTTQNSSTTFNTNTNTQNTQNTRTLYPASQFGNKGGNNQVGTIYTNKTTSYKNLNPTNQTQMSNNYDGNTVWNFDFNQFNTIKEEDSNVANTPHLVQNNQQEDLLDDHFFDNLGNPNIQDELKNIILKEEQSLPHQGQQFQFGNKQVSTDHWDQQSQVPNLLSLDSDKPNQPYSTNYSHHKRNSLTNHQLNEAPSPQPQQNQQQQINLQLNGQNQQGNQQSWYYQQNQQQQYQQAQQFQQNQYQQNNQFGHVQNNQMNYNQFNQNQQQQQQQQNGGGGATGYSSFNYSNNQHFNR